MGETVRGDMFKVEIPTPGVDESKDPVGSHKLGRHKGITTTECLRH